MSGNEFWEQDMTTVHESRNWFKRLSSKRKVMFCLLAVFIVAWCFFIGFSIAKADEPAFPEEWVIATSDDLGDIELGNVLEIEGIRTILLVGCDERDGYEVGRSDTMMVVFINGDTNEISLLSIPRDCYVQIPGYTTKTKINHSYAYGGINLTRETIEYFLGIKIDDYVEIDFDGFVELVDLLGGVEINVDQRMINYDEGINLNPGLQTLDGKQALGYCRFRIGQDGTDSISDIKRAEHQQNFIIALKDKLMSLSTLWKVPRLVSLADEYVNTTISTMDAIKLGNTLLQMNLDSIKTYTIPTSSMWINSVSYELVSSVGTMEILDQILGDDYDYTPHIVGDDGAGRYTAPTNDEPEDDTPPDLDLETPDATDPGTADPGITDPGVTDDPGTTDPGITDDPNAAGDASNVPEP